MEYLPANCQMSLIYHTSIADCLKEKHNRLCQTQKKHKIIAHIFLLYINEENIITKELQIARK